MAAPSGGRFGTLVDLDGDGTAPRPQTHNAFVGTGHVLGTTPAAVTVAPVAPPSVPAALPPPPPPGTPLPLLAVRRRGARLAGNELDFVAPLSDEEIRNFDLRDVRAAEENIEAGRVLVLRTAEENLVAGRVLVLRTAALVRENDRARVIAEALLLRGNRNFVGIGPGYSLRERIDSLPDEMMLKIGVDPGQEGNFFVIGEPWPLHGVFGRLKETEIPVEIVNPGYTAEQKHEMVKWYFGRRSVFIAHDWYALREWLVVVRRLGLLWRVRDVRLIVHLGTADEYVGYDMGRAEADERTAEVKDAVLGGLGLGSKWEERNFAAGFEVELTCGLEGYPHSVVK